MARSQWQILWLLAQGMPTAQVAQVTGYGVRWIQEIARRYRAGPEAIGDRRHTNPGAAPLLDATHAGARCAWRSRDRHPMAICGRDARWRAG